MSGAAAPPAGSGDNLRLAAALMLGNLSGMALVSVLVKQVATTQPDMPVTQILFFRFACCLPIFLWPMWRAGGISALKTSYPIQHVLRGSFGLTALALFFYAITLIPLADATALAYASPLFITLLSIPILGERVGPWRWSAIAVGLVGMLLIARPDQAFLGEALAGVSLVELGILAGVGSAFFGALVSIWLRRLGRTEPAFRIVIFYNGAGAILFGLWTTAQGWVLPDGVTFLLLPAIGLVAGFQQLSFALSYRYAEASLLAPFEFLLLPIAALLGFVVFGEIPAWASLAGAGLIVTSGLVVLYREGRQRSANG
ncbi:MAG: DMT family transporter [Pseudomonadota bacterium]